MAKVVKNESHKIEINLSKRNQKIVESYLEMQDLVIAGRVDKEGNQFEAISIDKLCERLIESFADSLISQGAIQKKEVPKK